MYSFHFDGRAHSVSVINWVRSYVYGVCSMCMSAVVSISFMNYMLDLHSHKMLWDKCWSAVCSLIFGRISKFLHIPDYNSYRQSSFINFRQLDFSTVNLPFFILYFEIQEILPNESGRVWSWNLWFIIGRKCLSILSSTNSTRTL